MKQKPFGQQVVIITGASSGIGAACALEFDRLGANVVLCARNIDALQNIANRLTNSFLVTQIDVTVQADCERLVQETIAKFGKIDVLINNAGITMRAIFDEAGIEVIQRLMDVNFWGTVYCTKYALPHLLKTGGSVVGVSSIAGFKGLPGRTGYSASKFAMQGFLESLRIENYKTGLHVLIACPGYTATNIRKTGLDKNGAAQGESPLDEKGLMSAEQVAAYIAKATQKRKKYLVLTRLGKLTVWLNRFFPSFIDGMVYNSISKEKDSILK